MDVYSVRRHLHLVTGLSVEWLMNIISYPQTMSENGSINPTPKKLSTCEDNVCMHWDVKYRHRRLFKQTPKKLLNTTLRCTWITSFISWYCQLSRYTHSSVSPCHYVIMTTNHIPCLCIAITACMLDVWRALSANEVTHSQSNLPDSIILWCR